MDRRDFALASLALAAGAAPAADSPKADAPKPLRDDEALLALIVARFGRHLDEAKIKAIRGRLRGPSGIAAVCALKLDWQDEPAFGPDPE